MIFSSTLPAFNLFVCTPLNTGPNFPSDSALWLKPPAGSLCIQMRECIHIPRVFIVSRQLFCRPHHVRNPLCRPFPPYCRLISGCQTLRAVDEKSHPPPLIFILFAVLCSTSRSPLPVCSAQTPSSNMKGITVKVSLSKAQAFHRRRQRYAPLFVSRPAHW